MTEVGHGHDAQRLQKGSDREHGEQGAEPHWIGGIHRKEHQRDRAQREDRGASRDLKREAPRGSGPVVGPPGTRDQHVPHDQRRQSQKHHDGQSRSRDTVVGGTEEVGDYYCRSGGTELVQHPLDRQRDRAAQRRPREIGAAPGGCTGTRSSHRCLTHRSGPEIIARAIAQSSGLGCPKSTHRLAGSSPKGCRPSPTRLSLACPDH